MMAVILLDPALLPPLLGAEAVHFNVDSIQEVDSTNDELNRRMSSGVLPSGSVLVADRQTAGKGRQGRVWSSSPEASLTFSLYWRFAVSPQHMAGLSLAVGLALHRALQSLGAQDVALKWPNDVLCRRSNGDWAKLAGILIELSPGKKGVDAIIGIGLNLFPVQISELTAIPGALPPGALADVSLLSPERHEVLATILRHIRPVFHVFKNSGLAGLKAGWEKAHAWQGLPVSIHEKTANKHGEICSGICAGITDEGALIIITPAGCEHVFSGDVTLRPLLAQAVAQDLNVDTLLCLDAGNTRLKWGVTSGTSWVETGVCGYDDLAKLEQVLAKQRSVVLAGISNVAGAAAEERLQKILTENGIELHRVASAPSALGVESGYQLPETLGVDRWCALVAAWQRENTACLVVGVGTATTIDVLDGSGRFCGGMILPGITLMRQSLAERTAQLPSVDDDQSVGLTVWPNSTAAAILVGSVEATVGAVERAWLKLSRQLGALPRCLITGGAAEYLVPYLGVEVQVCEHLVLEGVRAHLLSANKY